MTGGDPYFRTGTDVALLFEAKSQKALRGLLETQIAASSASVPGLQRSRGTLSGVDFLVFRSEDRQVCSYLASLDDRVLAVTNSQPLLKRLIQTRQSKLAALDSLDEYTFFRQRYPLDGPDESALLIVSDPAIRRWCA